MNILPNLNADRILVVEDNLVSADHMVALLRGAGYVVQNAYNCGDAAAADHTRFDLALVDPSMRDRDGRSITDYIQGSPTFGRLAVLNISKGGEKPQMSADDDAALLRRIRQLLQETREIKERPRNGSRDSLERPTEPGREGFDAHLQQQLAELKTLSELGRSISSVLDVNEVLNQIVEAATTLTHAEEGLLLLPDIDGQTLYLRAMKGIDDDSARNFRIKNENSLVGAVFQSGEPALVNDRGLQRVKTEYFARSLLYVPLLYKGRIIGVLGVNNRLIDRAFTQHDQELLLDLAAHAAIAIENAHLYEESLLQNRQLSILVKTGSAVNSTLALGDVLSTICQETIRALQVNACSISQQVNLSAYQQIDQLTAGMELSPLASTWQAAWHLDEGPQIDLSERPVLKRALEQSAFYTVSRQTSGDKWRQEIELLRNSGAAQMLMLPVRSSTQQAIGALHLYYRGDIPEITPEFRATLRHAALAICTTIAQKMGAQKPTSAALPLQSIFLSAQQLLDEAAANWLTISLLRPNNKLAQIVEYGSAVFLDEPTSEPRPETAQPWVKALGTLQAINYHAHESNLPDDVRAAMDAWGAKAILCLPLAIKGSLFGVVTIYDTLEARNFEADEISLAQALITQAATAIENARLYRDLEGSLTELKYAQAKLVQTARLSAIGELAAIVAHQINNPLTTVIADAELILEDLPNDSPWREGVAAIHRAGKRSLTVVKRLLSNARRGAPEEKPRWLSLRETIQNTLELVTAYIERNKVRLKLDLDAAPPMSVYARMGQLEDVWLNLLLNARDALQGIPNATITVECRYIGEEADLPAQMEVAIQDNGPGISAERLTLIFDPFFTTKPAGEGTGLGLYICKQIIEQCQGSIRVESVLNQGTCFRIRLPARSEELQ